MKYKFVGTCVNSFDEDGNCIIFALPWQDVTDFAQQEENSIKVKKEFILNNIDIPGFIFNEIKNKNLLYLLSEDDTFMIYNEDNDIHYFFRR